MLSNKKQVDLLTVSYCDEIRMLELQARSISQHADPAFIGNIYVVSNEPRFSRFKKMFYQDVFDAYGEFKNRVRLVDGKKMLHSFRKKGGWVRQQILKLLAVHFVAADYFLILDSKNHFIRTLSEPTLFTAKGKMRTVTYPLNAAFTEEFIHACQLFGVEPADADFVNAMQQTTPYLANKGLVKRTLAETERLLVTDFESAFINSGPFTEFYLYYAFILSEPGLFEKWYSSEKNFNVTFWNPATETAESFENKLHIINQTHTCSIGIHKRYIKRAPKDALNAISEIWRKAGLITANEGAEYFMEVPQRSRGFFWLTF